MWGWYNWNNLKEEKIFKSCYSLKGFQLSDSTSSFRFYLVKIQPQTQNILPILKLNEHFSLL